jgi:membrane protease YdiL (CAAX protease family)
VEINFRGFILGRLESVLGPVPAIVLSALVFSFDPFMTATFHELHWIALWDGIVWGTLTWRLGSLWPAIVAHAVEVIVMYSSLKAFLE